MSAPGLHVGLNVRQHRSALGLSLAELATAIGISKSTLHQIEQGAANPRLETLYAIATGLGVGLADLLDEPTADHEITRSNEGPIISGDAVHARLQHRLKTGRSVEVYDITVSPTQQRSEPHVAGTSECIIVHTGTVEVGPVHDPLILEAGDSAWFDSDCPHSYKAVGQETATATLLVLHP